MNTLFNVNILSSGFERHIENSAFSMRTNVVRNFIGKTDWGANVRLDYVYDYYVKKVESPRPTKLQFDEKRASLLHRRAYARTAKSPQHGRIELDNE